MQSCLRFIILFICLITGQFLSAQKLSFQPITGANGISLGKINAITHDKYGYLWLSDQSNRCIIRYDGNRMVRYQNSTIDTNSLGGYYPECLFADSTGNIWIGFFGSGLDKFDPNTNTFSHYRHKKDDPNSLASDTVSAILVDGDKIWIGTQAGIDLFDQKTGRFSHYQHNPNDPNSLSWNAVRSIYRDNHGDLWIGTGLIWSNTGRGGLNRYNRSTNNFTRYIHDPNDPASLAENNVRCIFEDSYGNFWIGTGGVGIQSLDRKTGKFTHYPFDPTKPEKLSRSRPRSVYDNVTFIVEDATRKIWFGTYAGGMVRFDPATKKTERINYGMIGRGGVNDTTGWAAHALPDGTVWISTELNNFFKVDAEQNKIPFISAPGFYYGKALKEGDELWLGVTNGFLRKNQRTGATKFYPVYDLDAKPPAQTAVFDLYRDKKGVFWISSSAGLYRLNESTEGIERIILDSVASQQPDLITLNEDSGGRLWCTSFTGLFMLNPNRNQVKIFRYNPMDQNSPSSDLPVEMLEIADQEYLIAFANNGGMNKFSLKTNSWTRYHFGLNVYQIKRDKNGVIWAASQGGLFRYDTTQQQFLDISQDGHISNLGELIAMAIDRQNNIWVSSRKSLFRLNAARDQITEFGEYFLAEDIHDFRYGAANSLGDWVYFGSDGGYYYFNPDSIQFKHLSGKIHFSGFWLNNKKLSPSSEGPLLQPIPEAGSIDLHYNQNTFSFSASLINFKYSSPEIEYQMEPYDGQWRPAQLEEKIQYFNLPPGQYLLKIRASNIDGGWITKEMTITIHPPWWKTTWAYAIYLLLGLLLIYGIDRFQRRRIREQERMRNKERELEQAKEIEKAYHQLKATQTQLIQAEKMASLGELTAGIAHEIQNPLNFVNNFAEVNTELITELRETQRQGGGRGDAEEILDMLADNEQKILHHGKRADSIVKSMLQHTRSTSGMKEPTDINALAEEYLRLAYHGLRAKDKSFQSEFRFTPDPILGQVNIVPQDVGRVLLNLINNAFYAVQAKTAEGIINYVPMVEVSTSRSGDKVILTVKDNGKGIPSSIKNKIFQPFFTTKPAGAGTGLGLSLSYDIIKAHGGEIKVDSTEGEGTTFIILLPSG